MGSRVALDLHEPGPSSCVLTLSDRGAVVADGATHHQPAFPVHAVDSTGAGDAFNGAPAAVLVQGVPIPEAVRVGCAAGALATTALGAQSALPTSPETARLLAALRRPG